MPQALLETSKLFTTLFDGKRRPERGIEFDWISGIIDSVGVLGIALLMLLESVFPPIPSELIMPLAGFNAASGQQSTHWSRLG